MKSPASAAQRSPPSFSMSRPLQDPSSLKVLVVDDEEPVRQVLEALLVLSGHRVGLAHDGVAALAKFQSEPWDLVLTDRRMPGMGGEELAGLLKAQSPHTPVIMVTGVPPPAACAEIDAMILKPFSLDSILEAIDGCVTFRAAHGAPQPIGAYPGGALPQRRGR